MTRGRPPSVRYALDKALKAVRTGPEHAPAVALARRYAVQIDEDPAMLGRLGRPFLAVLVELRMTPRARSGVIIGDNDKFDEPASEGGADGDSGGDAGGDPLDELRSRRDRRRYGAAAVDPAAP